MSNLEGPWVANFVTGFVRDKDGRAVAAVYGGNVDYFIDEVGIERTRLVAAAPELLAALERSLDWLSSYPGGGATCAYDQARAAIAKAMGTYNAA